MDRCKQLCGIRIGHSVEWRPTGISFVCLWTIGLLSICLDSNYRLKTRYVLPNPVHGFFFLAQPMLGGNAVVSLIFSEYLNRVLWRSSRDEVSPDDIPQWAIKLTAVGAIAVVTILCIAAQKLGSRAAVFFTTLKVSKFLRHSALF